MIVTVKPKATALPTCMVISLTIGGVLGTTEILLLNHTGCGFTTFTDNELNAKLSASTGDASPAPMCFFSYSDPEQNTQEQINKVRSHPWIAKDVPVRGFIFDVEKGLLREVQPIARQTAP
jgi:carbonic anhydrase